MFGIAEWFSLWADESAHSSDDGSDSEFIVTLQDLQGCVSYYLLHVRCAIRNAVTLNCESRNKVTI